MNNRLTITDMIFGIASMTFTNIWLMSMSAVCVGVSCVWTTFLSKRNYRKKSDRGTHVLTLSWTVTLPCVRVCVCDLTVSCFCHYFSEDSKELTTLTDKHTTQNNALFDSAWEEIYRWLKARMSLPVGKLRGVLAWWYVVIPWNFFIQCLKRLFI